MAARLGVVPLLLVLLALPSPLLAAPFDFLNVGFTASAVCHTTFNLPAALQSGQLLTPGDCTASSTQSYGSDADGSRTFTLSQPVAGAVLVHTWEYTCPSGGCSVPDLFWKLDACNPALTSQDMTVLLYQRCSTCSTVVPLQAYQRFSGSTGVCPAAAINYAMATSSISAGQVWGIMIITQHQGAPGTALGATLTIRPAPSVSVPPVLAWPQATNNVLTMEGTSTSGLSTFNLANYILGSETVAWAPQTYLSANMALSITCNAQYIAAATSYTRTGTQTWSLSQTNGVWATSPSTGYPLGLGFGSSTFTCTVTSYTYGGKGLSSPPRTLTVTITRATPVMTVKTPVPVQTGTSANGIAFSPTKQLSVTVPTGGAYTVSCTLLTQDSTTPQPVTSTNPTIPFGVNTFTCTATATASGMTSAPVSYAVTVNYAAPVLTIPSSAVSVDSQSPSGATIDLSDYMSATCVTGGAITFSCTGMPSTAPVFPVGTTSLSCTATANGVSSAPQPLAVTVNLAAVAPVLTVNSPAPVLVGTSPAGAVFDPTTQVTATVATGGTATISCSMTPPGSSSPQAITSSTPTFPLGVTSVSCVGTANGLTSAPVTFSVTVNRAAPVLTVVSPAPVLTGTSPAGATFNPTSQVTATVVTGGTVAVSCTMTPPGSSTPQPISTSTPTFPLGVTSVSCVGTAFGLTSDPVTYSVTVNRVAPVLVIPSTSITLDAASASGVQINLSAYMSATCVTGGPVSITCINQPATSPMYPIGVTQLNCAASSYGLWSAAQPLTITVRPVLTVPLTTISAEPTSPAGASMNVYTMVTVTTPSGTSAAIICALSGATTSAQNVVVSPSAPPTTFAMGDTSVMCAAKVNNVVSATKTFPIHVLSPAELASKLVQDLQGASGAGNSLMQKATKLQQALSGSGAQSQDVCNQVNSFNNEVNALVGKKNGVDASLASTAANLSASLACSKGARLYRRLQGSS